MQFCSVHKCIRGVQLHRGVQRRQPWLLRPTISAGRYTHDIEPNLVFPFINETNQVGACFPIDRSGSSPESTNEMVTAGQEKQPASDIVPTTAAESNPLLETESLSVNKAVHEDFQPGPSSTDDDQEREAAVDASSSTSKTLTVHPLDDVEEEEDFIASKVSRGVRTWLCGCPGDFLATITTAKADTCDQPSLVGTDLWHRVSRRRTPL